MEVTIGGDRLGSGKKMQTNLRNFERSTHNLKEDFTSSIAPGVLYPFYCNVGLNGDTFNIKLNADCITLPTTGPLFGSFKLQLDMFVIPMRLYQAILHNNPVDIGLKMNQVKLPKMDIYVEKQMAADVNTNNDLKKQINNSALLKYLGISGVGLRFDELQDVPNTELFLHRKFNAIPMLAYYDIFKCYYSNKQETNAYVITPNPNTYTAATINEIVAYYGLKLEGVAGGGGSNKAKEQTKGGETYTRVIEQKFTTTDISNSISLYKDQLQIVYTEGAETQPHITLSGHEIITKIGDGLALDCDVYPIDEDGEKIPWGTVNGNYGIQPDYFSLPIIAGGKADEDNLPSQLFTDVQVNENLNRIQFVPTKKFYEIFPNAKGLLFEWGIPKNYNAIKLKAFPLANIDKMRMDILSNNQLGDELVIKADNFNGTGAAVYYPYLSICDHITQRYITNGVEIVDQPNRYPMNGLVVKTYQSDLFNNWIQTEWIDGENGINQITKINTTHGLQFDALVLQKKTWDMLNRIAISGGTYQDWQEAVYTEKAHRHAETPMWVGGYSSEIVFEQIIQTSPTEGEPLGTLGGRGKMIGTKHGGNIKIKITEPSIIMGIASITPRISYSQGNAWYMTELDTLDDLHKPSLDGIGFQNLICEQMAWWDAQQLALTGNFARHSAGKVPAWINYMTAIDKVFGDFADNDPNDGKAFMALSRRYEVGTNGTIKDLTTYIDPQKYNYAFADASLTAQNFWLSIRSDVTARRKMSAKIIPNL